ncbi:MAG: GGDEF domain-containing protein [Rhodoferax sp.]|jgi:diguanylate cyclase (GGDEF)-like protein|nr:GGDEF domain-containing protein [Rhodoferax sp.]MBP9061382.1 GGDEF domain-containing protein [Rhodoferax sp.]MBP9683973.1 GGDEF domain-containing protein [Rhodoferax sp.]
MTNTSEQPRLNAGSEATEAIHTGGFHFIPKDDPKQAIRIKRLGMSFLSYQLAIVMGAVCVKLDFLSLTVLLAFSALVYVVNGTFYTVIRSGLNLRLRDPSLTLVQMAAAVVHFVGLTFFVSSEGRAVFLFMSIVVALYGTFRLNTREFILISVVQSLSYAGVVALLYQYRPEAMNIRQEILLWVCLSIVLSQVVMIGGYISHLRQKMQKQNSELEKAVQTIHDMAIRDELTGVYNRRFLMDTLNQEKARSDRNGFALSVCILDIDFFKKVNDTYGHGAGDEVLKLVAKAGSETLRVNDYFGRYGGEEFLMVLTQTSTEGAIDGAQRVRRIIEALKFPDIGEDFKVTASIGLAQYTPKEEIAAVIARADTGLYKAKENGRNQVVCSE